MVLEEEFCGGEKVGEEELRPGLVLGMGNRGWVLEKAGRVGPFSAIK